MKQPMNYKLEPTSEQAQALLDTMTAFSAACNDILKTELQEKTNRYKLHDRYYSNIKERHGLTADYVVRAIARVAATPPEREESTGGI